MTTTDPNYDGRPAHNSGIAHLIGGLISDVTTLFRQEIELAKTEAGERVQSAAHGGAMLAVGGVLGLGALGVFLAGVVTLLTAWFATAGLDPMMASTLAALAVTIVVGLIAWIMISNGINRLKATNFKLPRTAHTLSADADAVKERI